MDSPRLRGCPRSVPQELGEAHPKVSGAQFSPFHVHGTTNPPCFRILFFFTDTRAECRVCNSIHTAPLSHSSKMMQPPPPRHVSHTHIRPPCCVCCAPPLCAHLCRPFERRRCRSTFLLSKEAPRPVVGTECRAPNLPTLRRRRCSRPALSLKLPQPSLAKLAGASGPHFLGRPSCAHVSCPLSTPWPLSQYSAARRRLPWRKWLPSRR